jgi:hypothetical protein
LQLLMHKDLTSKAAISGLPVIGDYSLLTDVFFLQSVTDRGRLPFRKRESVPVAGAISLFLLYLASVFVHVNSTRAEENGTHFDVQKEEDRS